MQTSPKDGAASSWAQDPLCAHPSWTTYERFNVSFERVASGWDQFDSHKAAEQVGRIMQSTLTPAENNPRPGRLFIVGNMGHVPEERIPQTLKYLEDGLSLVGDLRIKSTEQSPAGTYIVAQQTVRDTPIYGARLTLHRKPSGLAYAVVGTPAPKSVDIRASEQKISPKEATEVVAGALQTNAAQLQCTSTVTFLPVDEELLACYHIKASARDPFGDWYGFVTFEGDLLALFNVASSATARAKGYTVNPTRTPDLSPLQLTDLLDPLMTLVGLRSKVWGPNQTQVTPDKDAFLFDANHTEFDEPQLYYFLEFCRSNGELIAQGKLRNKFQEKQFNPMIGSVHDRGATDNAYYSPNKQQLYFGDTRDYPTRYSSRSLDVVLHEFGHAVSDSICGLGRAKANDSSRAMSEGYSDYFAATILNNPIVGEYFAPNYLRTCANKTKFPRAFAGEEHAVGTVWAGLLWELRSDSRIGQDAADQIMLQSLSYLGPWRTIPQGIDALVQADRALFANSSGKGRHEDTIRDTFGSRIQ